MTYANWRIDPKLVRTCVNKSEEMIEWLEQNFLSGEGSDYIIIGGHHEKRSL